MKVRTAKKIAKEFLTTGKLRACYRTCEWWYDDRYYTELLVDGKLYTAIYREALRRGWDGYWADSPFILSAEAPIEEEEA